MLLLAFLYYTLIVFDSVVGGEQCFIASLCQRLPAYSVNVATRTLSNLNGSTEAGELLLLVLPESVRIKFLGMQSKLVHIHTERPIVTPVLMDIANVIVLQLNSALITKESFAASVLYAENSSSSAGYYAATQRYTFSLQHTVFRSSGRALELELQRNKGVAEEALLLEALSTARVGIEMHQYGALMMEQLHLHISQLVFSLPIDTKWLSESMLLSEMTSYIYFTVKGIFDEQLPLGASLIETNLKEVGSYFFQMMPVLHPASPIMIDAVVNGLISEGYTEIVLSDAELARRRGFHDQAAVEAVTSTTAERSSIFAVVSSENRITKEDSDPINICIWSADKLDGQRQIWLLQTQHMDPNRFRFIWIMMSLAAAAAAAATLNTSSSTESEMFGEQSFPSAYDVLEEIPHAIIAKMPIFRIKTKDFSEVPDDGSEPFSVRWSRDVGNSTKISEYIHERIKLASYNITRVQPSWCRMAMMTAMSVLKEHRCDIVVYGNSPDFNADVMITDAARALNIPSVAELVHMFVNERVIPDAIVAPSKNVLDHPSVRHAVRSIIETRQDERAIGVIISPSVDVEHFKRPYHGYVSQHPKCNCSSSFPSCCVVVGYMARLSPEKNPGLFLQAAYLILKELPIARFTIIGDGELRGELEDLAERLNIRWAVQFVGWVDQKQLPEVLAGIDVIINTSLVFETFCIANIEAMSMGIPLITFAVGGIGEYIAKPANETLLNSDSFVVTTNGIIVNRANPTAIAQAAVFALNNMTTSDRQALGQRGRNTIAQYFNVDRQMRQYEELYRMLHERN